MADAWLIWWSILCSAAVINIVAWSYSGRLLGRRQAELSPEVYATRRQLLWLAGVYVLGCGFRSVLPMIDVPRFCLHDTWLSRIVIGRSVATVAELCFAAQWAVLLREAGAGRGLADVLSRILMPLIVAAELFSWAAVLKGYFLLHAVENSLWTLGAVLTCAGFVSVWPRVSPGARRFLAAGIFCSVIYVIFMTTVDVPMYLSRWEAQLAAGQEYLTLREGLHEVLQRCVVTRDWANWREDVPWLSLYFTVAVWISITLAHAPSLRPVSRPGAS